MELRAGFDEQIAQYGTVTSALVLAVAPDRKIGFARHRRQQSEEALGRWFLHFGAICSLVPGPALRGKGLR